MESPFLRSRDSSASAIFLTFLMVFSTTVSVLLVDNVQAHDVLDEVIWEESGSNDTGWMRLDAVNAQPELGQKAQFDWQMDFAPGAKITNLSLQIRVNGSLGLSIEEPLIISKNSGEALFDWYGYGRLGGGDSLYGANPHEGRLTPNVDNSAEILIPEGAEITDMILQSLSPADPAVSLNPIDWSVTSTIQNPNDGSMFMALDEEILVVDAHANPVIIDVLDLSSPGIIYDMDYDSSGDRFLFTTENNGVMQMSGSSYEMLSPLPNPFSAGKITQIHLDSNGKIWGFSQGGLLSLNSVGTGWTMEQAGGTSQWPFGIVKEVFEINGIIYAANWGNDLQAEDGAGLMRWDLASMTALNPWSTANQLHSDLITDIVQIGTQLIISSWDSGIGRYDTNSGFWLPTWNTGNFLISNNVNGLEVVNDSLFILLESHLQTYNTSSGSFGSIQPLSSLNLFRETSINPSLIQWTNQGDRSPVNTTLLITDGSGTFLKMEPDNPTPIQGTIRIGSSPTSEDMVDVIEIGNLAFIASEYDIDVFNLQTTSWITTIECPFLIDNLGSIGNHLVIGTVNEGLGLVDLGSSVPYSTEFIDVSDGLLSSGITDVASLGNLLIATHYGEGISILNFSNGYSPQSSQITTMTESDGLDSVFVSDVATYGTTAYIASDDDGVLRIDLLSQTTLTSWISTGVTYSNFMPISISQDIIHVGLYGYGVVRKDLNTGEILQPILPSGNNGGNGLASDEILALWTDTQTGVVYIGTERSLEAWDGSSVTRLYNDGNYRTSSVTNTQNEIYFASNAGLCFYSKSPYQFQGCYDEGDGLPDTFSQHVHLSGDTIFVGTTSGVGLFSLTNETVYETWEANPDSLIAETEIIDDKIYVALTNIGVARYDLSSNTWLPLWNEDNLLNSNEITSIEKDTNPNNLWVGGGDGLQLINTTTESEILHWPEGSSQYPGGRNPYQITIINDILHYRYQWQGGGSNWGEDQIRRIDLTSSSTLSNLDAGQRLGVNGWTWGMGQSGDYLNIGVSEYGGGNQGGGNPPDGGIAQWDTSSNAWAPNIELTPSINDVESIKTSQGEYWVAWGEEKVVRYDNSGVVITEFPSNTMALPVRGIVEWDNQVLFATEEGIERWDMSSNSWDSAWEPGNGLPNNAEDEVDEIYTDGTYLWAGTSQRAWWGFQDSTILRLDNTGTWTTWKPGGANSGLERGYPISIEECGGKTFLAALNFNGGLSIYDGNSWSSVSNQYLQDDDSVNSLACDDNQILYVGYGGDGEGISRYDVANDVWLQVISANQASISDGGTDSDALAWFDGKLFIGHEEGRGSISGGLSIVPTSGVTFQNGNSVFGGAAMSSFTKVGTTQLLMGQAGGGISRVLQYDVNTTSVDVLINSPSLEDGWITEVVGNNTHIYVATNDATFGGGGGNTGILEGIRNASGNVQWTRSWSTDGRKISDLAFENDGLWVSISGLGARRINLTTNAVTGSSSGLHTNIGTLTLWEDKVAMGLIGTSSTGAGVQIWNRTTNNFDSAALLNGLPSTNIQSIDETVDYVFIGTNGGIGVWNKSINDFDAPLTTLDGLSSNNVNTITAIPDSNTGQENVLYIATSGGLDIWSLSNHSKIKSLQSINGMSGDDAFAIATFTNANGTEAFISHRGTPSSRPSVNQITLDLTGNGGESVNEIHLFDQLPSNEILAVASDSWGVHILTTQSPLVHWNGNTDTFDDGVPIFQLPDDPTMSSDGTRLFLVGEGGVVAVSVSAPHNIILSDNGQNYISGFVSNNGYWLIGDSGLERWDLQGKPWNEINLRRANPLIVNFGSLTKNVSAFTHPGVSYQLIEQGVVQSQGFNVLGPNEINLKRMPIQLTSDVSNAPTWVKLMGYNYSSTLDLSEDPNLIEVLQRMVDSGVKVNGSQIVTFSLSSISDGSLEFRMIYDWEKSETPIQITAFYDTPNDGGNSLTAEWTLNHDQDFGSYQIFLSSSPWPTNLSSVDLMNLEPDASISLHELLYWEINTLNGVLLENSVPYWIAMVVEYNDGRFGNPAVYSSPAVPFDDIPSPPDWVIAINDDQSLNGGQLLLEWAQCQNSDDYLQTNIYASTTPFEDLIGLQPHLITSTSNSSILNLNPETPYWIAVSCVDTAGQEDLFNITSIGPVVPTSQPDDGVPPPRMEDVWAIDVPEDDGGVIEVGWGANPEDDCAIVTVYMKAADGEKPSSITSGFSAVKIIPSCEENSTYISSMNGLPLFDSQTYWVGVVASDSWLNHDLGDVNIVEVTPQRSFGMEGQAPDRITELSAWDFPDDYGNAIEISWMPSNASDFAFYSVWASEHEVDDLRSLSEMYPSDGYLMLSSFFLDKQYINSELEPISIIVDQAIYFGESIEEGELTEITPDVSLNVAVTVHDMKGNVHLMGLTSVEVLPIDNINDKEAPQRIEGVVVDDWPNDDGSALQIEFEPSLESDIMSYEIYAASWDYTGVGVGNPGPNQPALIVDAKLNPNPVKLDKLSDGSPIIPGIDITIAIVAVDSAGNSFTDELNSATGRSIVDIIELSEDDLPQIQNIQASWSGDSILVTWDFPNSGTITGYQIHLSETEFEIIDDAVLVASSEVSNSYLVTTNEYESLSSETSFWISVTPYAAGVVKSQVAPIFLSALEIDGTSESEDSTSLETNDLGTILSSDNVLLGLLGIVAIILVFLLVRRGGKSDKYEKQYQIQEATWGINPEDEWGQMGWNMPPAQTPINTDVPMNSPIPPAVESNLFQAAQRIQQNSLPDLETPPISNGENKSSSIDTSFLDDLL